MSIVYPYFLNETLTVHSNIKKNIPYPFCDPACKRYEVLRAVLTECGDPQDVFTKFGLTDYEYRKSLSAFNSYGVAGLIGLNSRQLTEVIDVDIERKIYVFKKARRWLPSTKMSILLKGFNHNIDVATIRHLYASYGWAHGTKPFREVDFEALNLKVTNLCHLQNRTIERESFFCPEDKLQILLEVFRTLENRGITKRFPGSRVSYEQYKRFFLSFGLLGLVNKARPTFRNSKLGFKEEGIMIFSKIQKMEKNEKYYVKILKSKNINIDPSCISKIFKKWNVKEFTSHFQGNLERLLEKDEEGEISERRNSPHRAFS